MFAKNIIFRKTKTTCRVEMRKKTNNYQLLTEPTFEASGVIHNGRPVRG